MISLRVSDTLHFATGDTMKQTITFLFASMLGLLATLPSAAAESVSETLDVEPDGKVRVSVVRGEVEVHGWEKNQVRVTGELDDATEEFIFKTDGDDTVIKVEIDDGYWDKKWNTSETDLVIHIPEPSRLIVSGVSTDVDVNKIRGGVELNSVSGEIEVNDVAEKVNVETVSGDVRITNSWGKMKVSSVSGDIDTDGKAVYFDAQSVSGDIEAVIGESEIVELTSVSGDIELKFSLMDDGRVDAETVSGDIELQFKNEPVNAYFEINTGPGGDIRNSITQDKPESSFIGAEEIQFKSGDGSATVEISTMSGTVSLEK